MRLIDADALKNLPFHRLIHTDFGETAVSFEEIDNAPTIIWCNQTSEGLPLFDLRVKPQGVWGKWVISEIQCPNCFEYFETDCYSTEELKKCPNCGAQMIGGEENG